MNPSVSIIVPVYNVEKYLEDCLNSLINQTLKDIEIICVDDGSSDKSLEILNAYAEKDSRIKVFSNNHSGPGFTRNFGLNHATGEYVLFVDSDDWLDMSACEDLYENSKSNNLDVLLFLIKNYDESSNQFYTDDYYDNVILPSSFDNTVFNHEDIKEYLFSLAVVLYNKFIKRSLIEKFNIRFPTQVFFEDNPFHFEVLLGANKLSIVREHLLIRRRRDSSITADIDDKFLDVIKVSNHVWNVFEKYNEFDNYLLKLSNYKVNYFRRWYNLIGEEFKSDYLKLMKDDFEELKKNSELYDKFFDSLNNLNKNFHENVLKSESYEELDNLNSQYQSEFESRKKINKQKKQLNEKRKELKQLENELKLKNDELIALQNKIDLEKNELEDKIKSFKDIIEESEKDLQVRYDNFVRYVDVKNAYFEDKEKELEDRRLSFEEFMSQRESDFNRYVDVKNAYFDDKETELSVEYLKFKKGRIKMEKDLEDNRSRFEIDIAEREKELEDRRLSFEEHMSQRESDFESAVAEREKELSDERLRFNQDVADRDKELEDRRLSFEEHMSQRESDFNSYVDVKNAYFEGKEKELEDRRLSFEELMSQRESDFESAVAEKEKELEDERLRFNQDMAKREKELSDDRLSFEELMSQRESDFEQYVKVKNAYFDGKEKELENERLKFNEDVAKRKKELESEHLKFENVVFEKEKELSDDRLSFEDYMSQRENDFEHYVDVKNAYFEGKEKELEDRRLSFEELMSQRESDFESAVAEKEKELEDERLRFNQDMAKREKELSDDRLSFEEYMSQRESDFEHHVDVKNVYFEKKEKELENERSKFNKDANKRENELFEKLWSFESDVSEKEKELEDNRLRFESVVAEKEKELEDNRLRFENEIIEKEKELQNNRLRFENIVAEKEKELSDERLTLEEDLSKREEEISNNMELLDLKERELEDIIHNRKFKFISKLVSKVPKISIIIPVYNVEDYLRQCLDSVVNQTLKDVEIICVDDGSTDDSLKILKEYEKRDFRFKVLTQKNRGPGAARNNALDVASGEYVMFLDSDDWLELDACKILYQKSKLNDLDMVFFLLKNYSEESGKYYEDNYYNLVPLGDEFDDRVFSYEDLGNLVFNISVSPCQKIYRRDILKDIRFLENIYFEDNPFYWETMFSSKRIAIIREHFYLRRRREASITISYDYKYMDCIYISNQVVDVFKKYDMFEYFNERLAKYKVGYLKQWYEVLDKDVKYEFWRLMKDDFAKIKNDSKYQMFIEYLSPDLRKFFESTLSSRSPYELEYLQIYGDE